jgi:hypothetical protein
MDGEFQMNNEELTTEFFKRRFPNKDINLEKRFGYFQEWQKRIATNPEPFMDRISLRVWEELKTELKTEEKE